MTTISIEFDRLGKGTRVRLEESGCSMDDVEAALGCAAGWGEGLTLLEFYLERGTKYGEVPVR